MAKSVIFGLLIFGGAATAGYLCFCDSVEPVQVIEGRPKSAQWRVVNEIRRFEGHQSGIDCVAISPDGKFALSGGNELATRLWDLAAGKELKHFKTRASSVLFSRDGRHVFCAWGRDAISMWNVETGERLRQFPGPSCDVHSLSLSSDGSLLAAGCARGDEAFICVWDVTSGNEVARMAREQPLSSYNVSFFPNGTHLLAVDRQKIIQWDVENDRVVRLDLHAARQLREEGHAYFNRAAFSTINGEWALMAREQNLALWNMTTGRIVRTWTGFPGYIHCVACSPTKFWGVSGAGGLKQTGRTHTEGHRYGIARLWSLENGEELCSMEGHTDDVKSVAFTPDGQFVLTGSLDKTMRLWALPQN